MNNNRKNHPSYRTCSIKKRRINRKMDLDNNTNRTLENLKNRIKELEQGKKKSDDENRLLHTFLLNEIGSKELDNLRKLLAGQKLTEILAELEERRQEVQNLNFDLKIMREEFSKLRSQFKDLEKEVKMREEETENKQKNILVLEERVRRQDEITKSKKEIINDYVLK